MIHRDRSKEQPPRELVSPKSPGVIESDKVKKWIKAGRKGQRPKFKAYKAASVGMALERLFGGKCAYCESRYNRTQPVDVDHWRPKAEVEIEGKKQTLPGYEWLSADWENLLPSCIDCNRQRYQTVLFLKGVALEQRERKIGKGNLFPILDESKRLKTHNDPLRQEEPLLINPCADNPERYFRYLDNGVVVPRVTDPKTAREQLDRDRALISIKVYALNREALVDERKERLLMVRSRFDLLLALIDLQRKLEQIPAAPAGESRDRNLVSQCADALKDLIEGEVNNLSAMADSGQPYALMARQYLTEFMQRIRDA